jgi:hypothetical protein
MTTAFLVGNVPNKERKYVIIEIQSCDDSINNFDRDVFDKNNAEYMTNKFKVIQIMDELCNEYNIAEINIYTKNGYLKTITINLNELVCCPTVLDNYFIKCFFKKKRALSIYPNKNYCISTSYKNSIATFYENGMPRENISFDMNNVKNNIYHYQNNISINLKCARINYGEYKKFSENGDLVIHAIYNCGSIVTDLLEKNYDYYKKMITKELEINANIYNKHNETIFNDNIIKILNLNEHEKNLTKKLKYAILILKYINSVVGLHVIQNNKKIRDDVFNKFEEYNSAKYINYTHYVPKKTKNKFLSALKIIKDKIDLIN